MNLNIFHDREAQRFEAVVDGLRSELDYRLTVGVMNIMHTGVPHPLRGQGIAAELVRAAFEFARAEGWKVRPVCPYVDVWLRRHPEWEVLRAGS